VFSARQVLEEEGVSRIPLKTIHVNRCPAIAPMKTLSGQEQRLGVDVAQCLLHMRQLQRASGIVEKISEAFARNEFPLIDDPDLMLYQGGFFGAADKALMRELRLAAPEDLSRFSGKFQDVRLDEMLFRYRGRNFPDSLSPAERQRWNAWRWEHWGEGQQLLDAEARIEAVQQVQGVQACLTDLQGYLRYIKAGLEA